MTFADDFRHHVMPMLRTEAARQGTMLSLDLAEWEDAIDTLRQIARHHGAIHLSHALYLQLEDWMNTELLRAELTAEARNEQMQADNARREQADPVSYYNGLASGCREDMRWAFAAICPAYRDALRDG